MAKIIGYIIATVGLILLLLNTSQARNVIPALNNIPGNILLIIGGIIILVGVVFLFLNKEKVRQSEEEVPIYQGKKIVGYRKA